MKRNKSLYILLSGLLIAQACTQDVVQLDPVTPPVEDTSCEDAVSGTASFTKFVAIGNSFVAGMQGGALFTDGQNNSLPAILNKQFECVGAPAEFKQPNIGASLGWNLFITQPFKTDNTKPILGRMLLQYGTTPDCTTGAVSPSPTPQAYAPGNLEALPNPSANPGFIYGDGSTKSALNNFGIPAIVLGQSLITQTGNWAGAASDPRFSPFYGRLAFPGTGTSTIIGDAAGAGGSFFLFWLGLDDFFLYAAYGGDPTKAPLTPATGGLPNGFDGQYAAAVGSLLASNSNLKGVVANFPNIFKMPHFTAVKYNPIPLDATSVAQLSSAQAFGGYNAALDALVANKGAFGISDELAVEIGTRKVFYEASCSNKILMTDETLTDLGDYFDMLKAVGGINDAQRAGLVPYEQIRQSGATDIIPLSTGSVLGKDGTFGKLGVSEPVGDQYVIIPTERDAIIAARTSYNATVKAVADANPDRVAFADIDAALEALITNRAAIMNGVTITPNIDPPTGIYSEDGVHPNTRGYAYLSTVIIKAINAKFGSTIPLTNLAQYSATGLPIPAN